MSVRRIYESPRVTKPYTDEQWQAISAWGRTIDAELERHDVRLTMGGEPTFVSSTTATAPSGIPRRSARRSGCWRPISCGGCGVTSARTASCTSGRASGIPGEQLPRWALACYWRRDGEPAWRDSALVADERQSTTAMAQATPSDSCARSRHARCHRRARAGGLRRRLVLPVARSVVCRRTSIRSTRGWTTSWSAIACGASSRRDSRRRRLRAAAAARGRERRAALARRVRGSCEPSGCI